MAARGHVRPGYGARPVQAPGMMRHGPFPAGHRPIENLPPNLENKLAVREAEIERLAGDNRRLAATDGALRRDLGAAEQDIQRLRAQIGSIQTESDIQIRVLADKISKMEAEIKGGEIGKKELQQAHIEAQSLVAARQELVAKIEVATKELEKTRADIKKLPEMTEELDSLRKEHQRLRTTFEYEKALNMENFKEMQAVDQDLLAMSRNIDRLHSEVLNAEKRARAPSNPYGGPRMNPDPLYPSPPPPPMHGGAGYANDSYGRSAGIRLAGEGIVPYGSGSAMAAPGSAGSAPGGGYAWGGAYETSHARR